MLLHQFRIIRDLVWHPYISINFYIIYLFPLYKVLVLKIFVDKCKNTKEVPLVLNHSLNKIELIYNLTAQDSMLQSSCLKKIFKNLLLFYINRCYYGKHLLFSKFYNTFVISAFISFYVKPIVRI